MVYKGLRVLVLDGYGRQIPSILHQLYGLGCVITTLNCSKLDVGYASRYPRYKLLEPQTRTDKTALKKVLDREILSGKYDVVFPMLEPATDVLTANADEYSKHVKIIAAPREAFLKAYDKQETMRICMEKGIPCPITKMDDETLDEYLATVSFPLACKPRKGSGSAGFKKLYTREDLNKSIGERIIQIDDYVIQEFIPQTEHMLNCYVMMSDNQQLIFAVVLETCRWYPIDGGPGCFAYTVNRPDVVNYSKELFTQLRWAGFGQVSFIIDPKDNTPRVLEINGRISAGVKITERAGCRPVEKMLDRAFGEKMKPVEHTIPAGLCLRYFHTDILWLIKSPNRFKVKPSWFDFRNNSDYIFSWADPLPFFTYGIEHIKTYKSDMSKRKHD